MEDKFVPVPGIIVFANLDGFIVVIAAWTTTRRHYHVYKFMYLAKQQIGRVPFHNVFVFLSFARTRCCDWIKDFVPQDALIRPPSDAVAPNSLSAAPRHPLKQSPRHLAIPHRHSSEFHGLISTYWFMK
jgi:hypothetical protein